jgi:hypothetical protein
MRLHTKLIVTALATMALFASMVGNASARNISYSSRNLTEPFDPMVWVNPVSNISCRVTMEGSFHCATISKVERALIGYISRATTDYSTCRSSSFAIRARVRQSTLPWHVTYVNFIGRLPGVTITELIERAGFELDNVPLVGTCNYTVRGEAFVGGPAGGGINEGNATIRPDSSRRYRSETGGCPETSLSSRPTPITQLGTTTAIIARLT